MGIGREAPARVQILPECLEILLRESALQIGAGVRAGRSVPLKIDLIAVVARFASAPEEMVVTNLVQRGGGGER
jgi:hypothetical protein